MGILTIVAWSIAVVFIAIKIYLKFSTGRYKINKDLKGKVVIITGGTAGIGKETAYELAKAGAIVHIACRNRIKGEHVAKELHKTTDNPNVFVHEMDLDDLKSVRRFAEQFLAKHAHIDILINNAGIYPSKRSSTTDGFDGTMQSNYFGHFLLTSLLIDRLKSSAPSRIINVSSLAHRFVDKFDVTDLNFKHNKYTNHRVYAWSKLCNVLFTAELAKRLRGTNVTTNSLHPGAVKTDIFNHQPIYVWPFLLLLIFPFAKTSNEGAQTTLYLAVSDEVEHVSGQYFSDCKLAAATLTGVDGKIAEDLWTETEKLLGIKFP